MNSTLRQLPLFLGGLLGPFGTMVMLPMVPELRSSFDSSTEAVSLGFTVYLFAMALFMVVSGTIGERFGRRRVVRLTFITYAVTSVLCAMAPTLQLFLVGRALQGVANAFITPLLLAGLAEITDPARLGAVVGIYSSFQAFGSATAPLVGGLLAEIDWRLAFFAAAGLAATLTLFPPPGEPRVGAEAPKIRELLTRRMFLLGGAALAAAAGPIGVAFLVGIKAREELGLSSGQAGVLLFAGGMGAALCGTAWGVVVDHYGMATSAVMGLITLVVGVVSLGLVDTWYGLALIWIVVGSVSNLVVVVLQSSAAMAIPSNRGGAVSGMLAFRFFGHALGPALLPAVYGVSPLVAFSIAAGLGIAAMSAILAFLAEPAPAAAMMGS